MYSKQCGTQAVLDDHCAAGVSCSSSWPKCYGFILFRLHGGTGPFRMTFHSMLDHLGMGSSMSIRRWSVLKVSARRTCVLVSGHHMRPMCGCRFSSSIAWTWTSLHGPASSLTASPA